MPQAKESSGRRDGQCIGDGFAFGDLGHDDVDVGTQSERQKYGRGKQKAARNSLEIRSEGTAINDAMIGCGRHQQNRRKCDEPERDAMERFR
jgi:hypothetical protein